MKAKDIRLYTAGGDLSKPWFLEWKEGDERKRLMKGINKHKTAEGRIAAAEALKQKLLDEPSEDAHDYLQQILDWLENRRGILRDSSIHSYSSKSRIFFAWLGRRDLDADAVAAFFEHLLSKRQAKKGTFNAYLTQLRFLCREVLKLKEDLFVSVKRQAKESAPAVFFNKLQVKQLSNKLKDNPDLWLAVQFLFYCFIRPGELRLLKVSDIDFEQQQILIRREIAKNRREQWVKIPKAFLPSLLPLQELDPNNYVLGGGDVPFGKNRLKIQHQAFLASLGYDTKRYKLYSWKHTGAVMAVRSGVNLKELQLQIRHHSLDELNGYLRQMGILELDDLQHKFPSLD